MRLRKAHAEANRLRAAKLPVPNVLRVLDCAYHDARRAARAAEAPAPDAKRNREVLEREIREHQLAARKDAA